MKKLLLVLPLLSFHSIAQLPLTEWGANAFYDAGLKLKSTEGSKYNYLGEEGVCFTFRLNGQDNNSLSWQQQIGIVHNKLDYNVFTGNDIGAERIDLLIQPGILIPGKNEHIRYMVGIGINYNIDVGATTSSYTSSQGIFNTNVDNIDSIINANSRKIIPFIMLGLVYTVNKHIAITASLKQPLMNYFEPGTLASFSINNQIRQIDFSYWPTFVGLSVGYTL